MSMVNDNDNGHLLLYIRLHLVCGSFAVLNDLLEQVSFRV